MNVCQQENKFSLIPETSQKLLPSVQTPSEEDVSSKTRGHAKADELLALTKLLGKLTTHMIDSTNSLVEKLKPELIKLSILVCEKFLRRKLEKPEELQLLLTSILNNFSSKSKNSPVIISLSPKDYSLISKWIETRGHLKELQGITFSSDPSIPEQACKISMGSLLLYQNLSEELDNLLTLLNS
ncbi:FliH/SctL family protein [Chlamydiifrater volucris]|uniref:FliH/SctL family protein n=1 Tax=Chlamydiifrater volucris TaxID=2681470 RepID=UPI001BCBEA6E|nr:FliH/SctL family protein [Chlamydiifrater volucris]